MSLRDTALRRPIPLREDIAPLATEETSCKGLSKGKVEDPA